MTDNDTKLISRVIEAVAEEYGVTEMDIRGKSRKREIVDARHLVIYIIYTETNLTTSQIGREFNRSHTSTTRATANIKNLLSYDKETIRHYENIQRKL